MANEVVLKYNARLSEFFDHDILLRRTGRDSVMLDGVALTFSELSTDPNALLALAEYPRHILFHLVRLAEVYGERYRKVAARKVKEAIQAR